MRRAVIGEETWIKAANVERKFRVSAKTLFRHKTDPWQNTPSNFKSVKIGGSRLYLIDQIKLVYREKMVGTDEKKLNARDILQVRNKKLLKHTRSSCSGLLFVRAR